MIFVHTANGFEYGDMRVQLFITTKGRRHIDIDTGADSRHVQVVVSPKGHAVTVYQDGKRMRATKENKR